MRTYLNKIQIGPEAVVVMLVTSSLNPFGTFRHWLKRNGTVVHAPVKSRSIHMNILPSAPAGYKHEFVNGWHSRQ